MNLEVLNGTARINGYANIYGMNGTARVQGTARINGASDADLAEEFVLRAMGVIPAEPIGIFGKKAKARRTERKAKKAENKGIRKARKEDKRALRDRRRLARTEALERGEGFFQKAAGALSNFGEAQKIAAEAQALAAEAGVPVAIDPALVMDISQDGIDLRDDAGAGEPGWFQKNWKWVVPAGLVLVGGGAYLAFGRNNSGRKKKRR